jgi:hypothetical protein
MNNAATLALTLLGITALDFAIIGQDRWGASSPFGRTADYGARLGQKFAERQQDNFDKERAARLFESWGEWRLDKANPSRLRLYDLSSAASRVFPAPPWLPARQASPHGVSPVVDPALQRPDQRR